MLNPVLQEARSNDVLTRRTGGDGNCRPHTCSIFRYAGSEICSNVFRCAQEVIKFLVEAVEGQQVAEQDTGNSLNG